LLGIRPENISVVDEGLPAQVEYIEQIYTDQIQLVYLKIGSQSCVAKMPLDHEINIGTTIYLQFPSENIYLFDQKSNIRIG
jgi:ABC-type sugar transport system ATPase subunit